MTEGERRALIEARNQTVGLLAHLMDMRLGHDNRAAALVSLRAIAAALGHTVEPINKGERE